MFPEYNRRNIDILAQKKIGLAFAQSLDSSDYLKDFKPGAPI